MMVMMLVIMRCAGLQALMMM